MAISRSDNTFRGARALSFGRTTKGLLGQRDRVDFYRFTASSQVDFSLSLSGLKANANVRLLNGSLAPISIANRPGNQTEQISATLESGTYYIQVQFVGRRGNTRYNLSTSATSTPPPPPPPGDGTIGTAFDIGVLTTTYIKQDTIGTNDLVDFYKFTLNDIANLDVRVNDPAAVRSVQLIRDANNNGLVDDGEIFAGQPFFGSIPLDIPRGTYFIRVEGFSNVSRPYELTLVPTLFGGNISPDPGNTLPAASDLGVFSGTRSIREYVGRLDTNDLYKFTLNDLSNLQVSVTGSSTFQFILDSNSNGLIDSGEVFASNRSFGVVPTDLPPGTYFINVEPRSSIGSNSYEMTLVGTPYGGNGLPDPGNTLPTARDLGILSGMSSLKEYVGVFDSGDVYKFTVSTPINFRATSSSSNQLDLLLIRDTNNNGLVDANETLRFGTGGLGDISLQAGTYFVSLRLRFIGNNISSNYELNLVAT